ncbi:MAG: CTP synthetase [Yoonia sp.]|nr:CTP synthetase [Yoonia sp.]
MFQFTMMLYSIIGTSVAGMFIVAALVSGNDTLIPILVAAGLGAVVALPASYLVARAIMANKK